MKPKYRRARKAPYNRKDARGSGISIKPAGQQREMGIPLQVDAKY